MDQKEWQQMEEFAGIGLARALADGRGEDALAMMEALEFVEGKARAGEMTEKPEPTTSEAFATVRRTLTNESVSPEDKAWGALSLLERRMGAMEALIREAMVGDRYVRKAWLERATAALTGAPPVFTLEEVEKAFLDTIRSADGDEGNESLAASLKERLSAPRR